MTASPHIAYSRVVVVGGGVAGIETVLALHHLAEGRLDVTLVAPETDFHLRPLAVAVPFSRGHVARLPLADLMAEHRGRFVRGALQRVDADARTITLTTGDEIGYDTLVLAPGAAAAPAFLHALTFGAHPTALNGILADLEHGWTRSVAFVVPRGCTWPLPLYELALMTAEDVWSMNVDDAEVHIVTPEREPLEIFGPEASAAVADLLRDARISLHCGASAKIPHSGVVEIGPGREIAVDCVVALPQLEGPEIDGIPSSANGFIPVDDAGVVEGLEDVYAVGDATDRPIKQGGLACQQADVTAAHIAAAAGAGVEVPALQQVLRGRLLTGAHDRFLRREPGEAGGVVTGESLWWAPTKVGGRYLSPYLLAKNAVHLPQRADAPPAGIDVQVPLTWQQKREREDILWLSPLGTIARR
ncbi:MAG: sulfide:quinone oxidoreductase [Solirubrobacteraceae bacterium]|nr:sulfide:quinone oxidoreductase [Solirubrobacteraceae bacterium]